MSLVSKATLALYPRIVGYSSVGPLDHLGNAHMACSLIPHVMRELFSTSYSPSASLKL